MKASQLITYLQNEIRKHGDNEVNVIAYGDDEVVVANKIILVSINGKTEIRANHE